MPDSWHLRRVGLRCLAVIHREGVNAPEGKGGAAGISLGINDKGATPPDVTLELLGYPDVA